MRIISGSTSKGGHYSPGIVSRGMLYISGQLPFDRETGTIVSGGITEQAWAALSNMERVLRDADLTKELVVLCRVYIPDISLWDDVNRVYSEFFGAHRPARVVVPTGALHHGALIEIEAIAEMPEED